MLDSLAPQLTSHDYLTVVFDARDDGMLFQLVGQYLEMLPCTTSLIMEPKNLGFWGHGIRNKHAILPGDFIMHGDDDDIYAPDALSVIRKTCKAPSTLYVFRFILPNGRVVTGENCKTGSIGTPSGVIPRVYNAKSWWAYYCGGDGAFYSQLSKIVPRVEHINHIIYQVNPVP